MLSLTRARDEKSAFCTNLTTYISSHFPCACVSSCPMAWRVRTFSRLADILSSLLGVRAIKQIIKIVRDAV